MRRLPGSRGSTAPRLLLALAAVCVVCGPCALWGGWLAAAALSSSACASGSGGGAEAWPEREDCSTIRRIAILGERHTGTNVAVKLLQRNLDGSALSVDGGFTGHKHWMQPEPRNGSEACGTLLVLPIRNPYDWAVALHRVCYCCEHMQALDFSSFVSMKYSPHGQDTSGQPCTSDVDITAGNATYAGVLSMRVAKLWQWVGLAQRWGMPFEMVRWEDLLHPELQVAWVKRLAAKYSLPLAAQRPPCPVGRAPVAGAAAGGGCGRSSGGGNGAASGGSVVQQAGLTVAGTVRQPALTLHGRPIRRLLEGRSGSSSDRDGGSSGGSSNGGADSSSSSNAGCGEAAPPCHAIQPVTQDARSWIGGAVSAGTKMMGSLYLNPGLFQYNPELRRMVAAVDEHLDLEFETSLGYHKVALPNRLP